jgi:hypothetical protein
MKFKFLLMLALVLILSVFASSKGYSGCENPSVICNIKCTESVTHADKTASDIDILELSPVNQLFLL